MWGMRMLQTKRWATAAAALVSIGWPGVSAAATLNVPGDFATIQACIDAAVSGVDECVVAPGTYHETINFLGKAITLRSSGGAGVTTIDATGIGGSVVTCSTGEGPDTVLDGFTITRGRGTVDMFDSAVGGGMYNYNSSPTVSNCTFNRNIAIGVSGGSGGGMYNLLSSPTVTNCTFSGNLAMNGGGGMSNLYGSATVTNCTFSGNSTIYGVGGGMVNGHCTLTVINCTFSANTAHGGYGWGGGMINGPDTALTISNCVLSGNSPDEIVNSDGSAVPTIRFSNVQGGLPIGAIDGGGNINLDPIFVRPPDPGPDGEWDGVDDDYGDLRLQAGSPCINAGDPGFVAQPAETDLEGHARVLCGRVDMGAYEFGIGDYDCDQTVNLSDFSAWSSCTTGPHSGPYEGGCEGFDFDGDGDVDLLDFGGFQTIVVP